MTTTNDRSGYFLLTPPKTGWSPRALSLRPLCGGADFGVFVCGRSAVQDRRSSLTIESIVLSHEATSLVQRAEPRADRD